MPRKFYRRKRKTTAKRGRKLSKFNVYTKTSAKSQASQIYALNKKVNGMYKKLKQDVDSKIILSNINDMLLYDNTVQVKFKSVSYAIIGSTTFNDCRVTDSGGQGYILPDAVLIKKVNFYIHWRFTKLYTGTMPAYLRVVIVRYKANQTNILANTDILNENTDAIIKVKGPLRTGLKDSGFWILGDYKFKITQDKPTLDAKIKIPGCKLQKGELLYPKYSTFAVVATYNPAAASTNDDQFTEGNIYSKLVYTNPSFTKSG